MYVIIFLIVAVAAVAHFVYQGILLPSYRLEMRICLFALRDKLRRLKADNPNLDEAAFSCVQNAINCWVEQTAFDLFLLVKVNNVIENDKQFSDKIAKRAAMIDNCDSQELKEIAKGVKRAIEKMILLNSGALCFYLFPLLVIVASFRKIVEAVRRLMCVSEWEMNKFTSDEAVI